MLDETVISRGIIEEFYKEFLDSVECEVAIAGAGPSGLCAAYYLAKAGRKTLVFERNLRVGGGMPGGGMLFNRIVVQKESLEILKEFGIGFKEYQPDYYVAHSLEALGGLTVGALKAGARIFNAVTVEDVLIREERVEGVVINWSAVDLASLHVDPLSVRSKLTIDATGHPAEVVRGLEKKAPGKLLTETGDVVGERPMWAELAEKKVVENTREVYPNLYVCGMAANAVFGGPRMGPIFGGMLMSGKKAAELAIDKISGT